MKAALFGYISKSDLDDNQLFLRKQILKGLAIAMQEYGTTTTGVAGIKDAKIDLIRKVMPSRKLIYDQEFKKLLDTDPQIVIGATQELITDPTDIKEIMPIDAGYQTRLIGTHVGLIFNLKEVYTTAKTDAEAIMKSLWLKDNNYKKAYGEVVGEATDVWWNQNHPDRIFMIKSGHPLAFVTVKDLKTIFYCSNRYSLEAVVAALMDNSYVYSMPETDHVYTITQGFAITKDKITIGKRTFESAMDEDPYSGMYSSYADRADPVVESKFSSADVLAIDKGIMEGCKKCKKDILEENSFYYNDIKGEVRCVTCGETSRPRLDWIKYSDDEYIQMVESANWNNIFAQT